MKKRYKLGILLLLILFCWQIRPACAETSTHNKVRVGVFSLGAFQNWDKRNDVAGYNVEYLGAIQEYTHWEYEYVYCENWIDAVDKLRAHKIDLLAPAQMREEMQQEFLYAANPLGVESGSIYTKEERKELIYEDINTMQDLVYGCVKDSTFTKYFKEEYCRKYDMDPKVFYYENTTQLRKALEEDEIDAMVTNILFSEKSLKLLARFKQVPVYYIMNKADQKLLQELDDAMININIQLPEYQSKLLKKYFPVYKNIYLSYSDMQYLKQIDKIVVGYIKGEAPLEADRSGKGFGGVEEELSTKVFEKLGLDIEYKELDAKELTFQELKEKQIDVIANVEQDYENLGTGTIRKTKSYLQTEQIFVVEEQNEFAEKEHITLALDPKELLSRSKIQKNYPKAKILECENMEECLKAVETNKADAVVGTQYQISHYLSKPAYHHLHIFPAAQLKDQICMGFVERERKKAAVLDDRIIHILDVAISQISEEEIAQSILIHTTENVYQYTLGDFLYSYRYFLMTILLMIAGICIISISSERMKRENLELIRNKNQQLATAIREANQASEAKGRFLAQMSHEIRTPMNVILGITQIAKNHMRDTDKLEEDISKIENASHVLLNLLNDILDMTAIEKQKIRIDDTLFDFRKIVDSVTTIYYQQCTEKGITFKVEVAGIVDEQLRGDPLRLNQILINLLSNAVKFTDAGGQVILRILQTGRKTDQVHMRFQVQDSGCGMNQEVLGRIFDPFEQAETSVARKHGGSGLGLAIVKSLIELMNGSILVESEEGKGTTFTVDLTFRCEDTEKLSMYTVDFADLHMLLVDDRADCEYTGSLLENVGVQYSCAFSGQEALQELGAAEDKGQGYNVCMLDWKISDMDGTKMAQKIRTIFGEGTIVIILTSYDINEVSIEGKEAGVDYFISKPVLPSKLYQVLMQIKGSDRREEWETKGAENSVDLSGKRILVAEDVEMNMEIISELLHVVGAEVEEATDGVEAVRKYMRSDAGTYQAILMDINMPNMDGYEAAQKIRQSQHTDAQTIPIYAMTANAFQDDIAKALDVGMNGHIAKPVNVDVLYQTLQNIQ